jgi:GNAT superfamily N-acetyltransferase
MVEPVTGAIRQAVLADVPAMVTLAERKRIEQAREQPVFWRKAVDSAEKHTSYVRNLLQRDGVFSFVHDAAGTLDGFVIGVRLDAPPVCDPGGPTCLIDDFTVAPPALWQSVGRALLEAARTEARGRGMVCIQVICGHYDAPKRAMLTAAGFPVVSEWWVHPL